MMNHLDEETQNFFLGDIALLGRDDFEQQIYRIVEHADEFHQVHKKKVEASWKSWIDTAFKKGAGPAHRTSK
eukprot:1281665-Pyramimonas_sp.AAC.1